MDPKPLLSLRRTGIVDEPSKDDYYVDMDGHTVGRLMWVRASDRDGKWVWFFHIRPNSAADRGEADSFAEATAAFAKRVGEALPFDPAWMLPVGTGG